MRILPDLIDAIRAHAEAAYPEECCGYLLGTFDGHGCTVSALFEAANRSATPGRHFVLDPPSYLAASRAAEAQGLDVVGCYHSHPDHPARPSATDLAAATFPGYRYVIVSVDGGTAADLTAWSLAPDRSRFIPHRIEVISSTTPSPTTP